MIKVGLTGNIGSGKSTVAGIFEVLGVPVFHADTEARKLLERPDVMLEIRRVFGKGVFEGDRIGRKKLAGIVFNNATALAGLNSIIHPRVRENLMEWIKIREKDHPYMVQEAAILFESGFHAFFDKNIVVACPQEIALARVMERDRLDEQEVRARMQHQWPEERKTALADFIINNDGTALLIPQVLGIHRLLLTLRIPYEGSEPF